MFLVRVLADSAGWIIVISRYQDARRQAKAGCVEQRLHGESEIIPAVNQIEVNPYLTQDELRAFCAGHQIAVEAWSPLGRGAALEDPQITAIAHRAAKTPAQVVLRWHLQRGDIVFPKSTTPARIKENIDIFDFELSGEDHEAITALNRNERTGPDPDKFDMV